MMANPIVSSVDLYMTNIMDVQYPTITLCTIQSYDRWNLPRLLLNNVNMECVANNNCQENENSLENAAGQWHETFISAILQ